MSRPYDPATHSELEAVVEAYGGDRTRWPAVDRLRFAPLIASDRRARESVAEAIALDRLLDMAPTVSRARERTLAARIAAMAAEEPRRPAVSARPVVARSTAGWQGPSHALAMLRRPAAAVLAASLLIGIVAGSSGVAIPAAGIVAEALGLTDDEPELAWAADLATGEDT